jgi:hypothetical protein
MQVSDDLKVSSDACDIYDTAHVLSSPLDASSAE